MKVKSIALAWLLAFTGSTLLFPQNVATVSVDVNTPGKVIPKDFEGISIQFDPSPENYFRGPQSSPAHVLGNATAPNKVMYQLIQNLGAGTLRTNSGLTSEPCWNASTAPFPEACPWPVTQDIVAGYAQASAATGWGIIVEINLAQNNSFWALQFADAFVQAVRATPGSRLTGFEIGNEPDLYEKEILFGRTRVRAPGYSWQDLVKDWQPYVNAFKNNPDTAKVPLIGPAYDSGGWTTPYLASFIDGVGAKNLGFVTVHFYPTDDCEGGTAVLANLLSESREQSYLADARSWVQTAHQRGLDLVLGETNSAACEGQKDVSDVFASAVWGLDWLFTNVNAGMRGLYFHLNNSYYSPVFVTTYRSPDDGELQYVDSVAPLYYAMYAFSRYAEGKNLLATQVTTAANIKMYAVRGGDEGPVTVFVINKEQSASGTALISLSKRMGHASLLMIEASTLTSRKLSFGSTTFDNSTGLLSGKAQTRSIEPDSNGAYSIQLPNASIAVLTIEP
jgi:hypothetical protein